MGSVESFFGDEMTLKRPVGGDSGAERGVASSMGGSRLRDCSTTVGPRASREDIHNVSRLLKVPWKAAIKTLDTGVATYG